AGVGNRDLLSEPLMRPGPVEVRNVLGQDGAEVALAEDDDVIQAFPSDAPEKALAGRVHQWRPDGRLQDADPCSLGHPIELSAELVVAIADDELGAVAERGQLPELLGSP